MMAGEAMTTSGGPEFVDPVPLNPRPAPPFAIGCEPYPTVDVANPRGGVMRINAKDHDPSIHGKALRRYARQMAGW